MAYDYFYTDNREAPYELIGYNFNLSIFFSTGIRVEESYENKSCINMSIVDVDNNLNWTFYLQVNLGKIEYRWDNYTLISLFLTYGMRYINSIKANITKIVLNPR